MKSIALILAGGKGSRLGSTVEKQFIKVNGHTILEHTLNKFSKSFSKKNLLIVLPHKEINKKNSKIYMKYTDHELISSGLTRKESVKNAIKYINNLKDKTENLLIHDAARPNVSNGLIAKINNGSNNVYGLQKPSHKFGATHPTINSELLYKIRHGKITPKVEIDHFEGRKVFFKDDTNEEFDVIIACTGFALAHPFFDEKFLNYREGPVPLYLKMFHPKYENLFFIGMFQPLGCIWPGAEQQSKLLALTIKKAWKRPSNIKYLCEREVSHPHMRQINTNRHRITVDYHRFMRDLKSQIKKAV